MDLWIRDLVDKTVIGKANNVYIDEILVCYTNGKSGDVSHVNVVKCVNCVNEPPDYYIKQFGVYANCGCESGDILIGIYATKRRALEVLDEIEKKLIDTNIFYETPKE